jgi:hypothetical protein
LATADILADYPLSKGRQAREDNDVLYDSSRNYLDQLDYYKRYRQQGHFEPWNRHG